MSSAAEQAKSIFLRALEIASSGERQAYLDTACAADESLRREVEELLEHHGGLGAFLEAPALAPAATGPFTSAAAEQASFVTQEGVGKAIGPYRLLQEIGEGGMGTVFLAQQTHPVQRQVALKLVKAGMD